MKRLLFIGSLIICMLLLNSCAGLMSVSVSTNKAASEVFDATSSTSNSGSDVFTSSTSSDSDNRVDDDVFIDKLTAYIKANGENVKKQIAAGNGDHLDAIAAIMEIKNSSLFKQKLQNNFDKIYTAEILSEAIIAKRIYKMK